MKFTPGDKQLECKGTHETREISSQPVDKGSSWNIGELRPHGLSLHVQHGGQLTGGKEGKKGEKGKGKKEEREEEGKEKWEEEEVKRTFMVS